MHCSSAQIPATIKRLCLIQVLHTAHWLEDAHISVILIQSIGSENHKSSKFRTILKVNRQL